VAASAGYRRWAGRPGVRSHSCPPTATDTLLTSRYGFQEIGRVFVRLKGCAMKEVRHYGGSEVTWEHKKHGDVVGALQVVQPEPAGYSHAAARQVG
jgi:hypothetical protein